MRHLAAGRPSLFFSPKLEAARFLFRCDASISAVIVLKLALEVGLDLLPLKILALCAKSQSNRHPEVSVLVGIIAKIQEKAKKSGNE